LHQRASRFACTAGNCRTGRSSGAWPDTVLRSGSCKNVARPRQPNGPKIAGPMRAKRDAGNQTHPMPCFICNFFCLYGLFHSYISLFTEIGKRKSNRPVRPLGYLIQMYTRGWTTDFMSTAWIFFR
jgi:hypothetical protein